jgi:hypothetical protein
MRLDRGRILGRVARPNRNMAKAEPYEQGAHAALGQAYAVARLDHLRQVDPPPADHPVLGQLGTGTDEGGNLDLLLSRQTRLGTRRFAVGQARQPFIVVSMHPIAERLPVHAATLRRLRAAVAFQNQRNSQHATGRTSILRPRRRLPQPRRVVVRSNNRNRQSRLPRFAALRSESQRKQFGNRRSQPSVPLVLVDRSFITCISVR